MDLPLFRGDITGSSVNAGSCYKPTVNDEVEDLHELVVKIKKEVNFDAICSGAFKRLLTNKGWKCVSSKSQHICNSIKFSKEILWI